MVTGVENTNIAIKYLNNSNRGYTFVEVMIFLAVSGALFASATSLIGGRQKSIRFSEAMRDVESKVQSIVADVSNGYYPNYKNVNCTATGGGPTFSAGASNTEIGQNQDCVLLGKAIQFSPNNKPNTFSVYTIAGNNKFTELIGGKQFRRPVQSLVEAHPKVLYTSLSGGDLSSRDLTDPTKEKVAYKLNSGSQSTSAIAIPSLTKTSTDSEAISRINATTNFNSAEVKLCFVSLEGDQTAELTIGGQAQGIGTKLEFKSC
jgi:type II secretory pathway pseudopilin PulG